MAWTLAQIADQFDLTLRGDGSVSINGLANLAEAKSDQLAFLFSPAYARYLTETEAAAVVLRPDQADLCASPVLLSDNPRLAWANVATLFDRTPEPDGLAHSSAIVDPSAKIGDDVTLGPNVVVAADVIVGDRVHIGAGAVLGEGVVIGEDTWIGPNATLYHHVDVGARCKLHAGVTIGADGFGYEPGPTGLVPIPQIYGVRIGNDVDLGAGTTVDRGALNDTEIGDGSKLDNQVQVGHGTRIGSQTAISGCTAIAGTTRIGSFCLIGGAVGIIDNIEICDRVEITAMTLVSQSITESGRYSSGTGLMPSNRWRRAVAGIRRIDGLLKRVRRLESDVGGKGEDGLGTGKGD